MDQNQKYLGYNLISGPGIEFWKNFEIQRFSHFSHLFIIQGSVCYYSFILQGSDPRAATCRGKLQSKRSKLNMEINKELMLRAGAENLFK